MCLSSFVQEASEHFSECRNAKLNCMENERTELCGIISWPFEVFPLEVQIALREAQNYGQNPPSFRSPVSARQVTGCNRDPVDKERIETRAAQATRKTVNSINCKRFSKNSAYFDRKHSTAL